MCCELRGATTEGVLGAWTPAHFSETHESALLKKRCNKSDPDFSLVYFWGIIEPLYMVQWVIMSPFFIIDPPPPQEILNAPPECMWSDLPAGASVLPWKPSQRRCGRSIFLPSCSIGGVPQGSRLAPCMVDGGRSFVDTHNGYGSGVTHLTHLTTARFL